MYSVSFVMKRALGLALLVFLGLCTAGCSKGSLPPTGQPVSGAPPAQTADTISTFTLVGHTEAGRKKWQVEGETADLLSEKVELSPVRATSFGRVQLNLKADRGRFDRTSQDVRLQGNVVAVTSDGARLTTESLDWEQAKETGTTDQWVTVTRAGTAARGLGGVGYPQLKRVRLERQVTVVMDGDEGVTVITCDGPMEVDYGRNKARFWRNVLVRDGKGLIRSDRLDATLRAKTHDLEKATFWGHVQIFQGKQVAFANRANYSPADGYIRLLGHPRMVVLEGAESP